MKPIRSLRWLLAPGCLAALLAACGLAPTATPTPYVIVVTATLPGIPTHLPTPTATATPDPTQPPPATPPPAAPTDAPTPAAIATAVLPSGPAPTPRPPNLLHNPGFEGAGREVGRETLIVAEGWEPLYCAQPFSSDCYAARTGGGSGNPRGLLMSVPVFEPTHEGRRVLSGRTAQAWWCNYQVCRAGVYQTFPTTPGQVCQVSAWVQSWSATGERGVDLAGNLTALGTSQLRTQDDRDNVTWYVRVDPLGGTDPWAGRVRASRGFGYADGVYDHYTRISLTFTAASDRATVFFENTRLWPFMHNASYLDNAYAGCAAPAEPVTPPPTPSVRVGPFQIVARHIGWPSGEIGDIVRVGEELWAYYSVIRDGRTVIERSTSQDGLYWTPQPGAVLEAGPPGRWDAVIGGPSVTTDPATGAFLMAFVAHTGGDSNYDHAIGVAASADGLRFERLGGGPAITHGPPGAWDEQRIDGAELARAGDGYVLYYVGSTLQPDLIRQIGCATSADGLTWAPCPSNPVLWPEPAIAPWEGLETELPSVAVHDGVWLMAYTGFLGPQGNAWRIGLAASADGATWTRLTTEPLVPAAGLPDASTVDPALVLDAERGQLWLYYVDSGLGSGVNVAVAPVTFGE